LAMYYHLLNGVRHLFWDAGYGYSLPVLKSSGIFVVILTLVLTALTWGAVYVL
jgi:succinate dehydrogenase / fumarate reductase cytochrome b subunit